MIFALGLATGLLVLLELDELVVVLVLVAAAVVFVAVESVVSAKAGWLLSSRPASMAMDIANFLFFIFAFSFFKQN
ncbi:hypothetical protein ACXO1E_07745 [Lactobacillus delbrueckii subsp. bulgaricus]|nr:hypothetical protein [Lactobacillus delbrueckii subsp. bulgaricus]MBT8833315.1 hypothetical protein [Lactobacillus delbrueckii subsp. bulgaricus]MBT8912648.1 hypothetical protein [Lactobacillus delbrueckii subsp. bulgaricus]MBT8915500.1 hypothetical protein [Lactobacillus delbrueckii subsp. bulgaricus]MBT8935708.1 hypothetical protein [Lactobacillus delbrueckii subsp. bulgaricus]